MSIYSVDASQIATSAAQVCQTAQAIRTEVDSLMAQLLALQSSWSGVAHANFQSAITSWQGVHAQVNTSLDAISSQLTTAASVYDEAENQSMALFASA